MLRVETITTEELGDRTYVAHDGTHALVVDPQRDLDRVDAVLDRLGLTVGAVLETHVHNDYVTGGFELARRTGARYVLSAADDVTFARHPVRDGDELRVGDLRVRAVSTPGHTDTHMAYVVSDADDPAASPVVFTGGSLLYGSVGRTDLIDADRTEELTRAQFHSARHLAAALPAETTVLPTHGFGSFCSAGATTGGDTSTIGLERTRNDALVADSEDAFVARLIAGLTAYPAYYAHMAPLNRRGPADVDLSPLAILDATALGARIAAGEWVVDLRDRTAYAAQHLRGTVGIELGTQFATFLGWLLPWDCPLTLIGDSAGQVADAQRQLVRIGIDRPDGAVVGTPDGLADGRATGAYPRVGFADLAARWADGGASCGVVALDVRRPDERTEFVRGSVHLPLYALLERMSELPEGQLWVHCASGYRASIGAGLLARAGRDVVLVDDDFARAVEAGLTVSAAR